MAISNPQVSDYVHYNGYLIEDGSRDGRVLAVADTDDLSNDKMVTVLFDDGLELEVPAMDLTRPVDAAIEHAAAETDGE